jgi:PPE-repeat protein
MLWHAMPPELNTARLMAGAGPAPMLQAAAGWEGLAAALEDQAAELAANLAALKGAWTGAGSERATAAAAPMVTWLETAGQAARKCGMQAGAQAAAYMKALGMTPSLPEIAANKITHTVLVATNFLGINMVPIGFNEMDYFVRMWNQAGAAMDIYEAETLANTVFEPVPEMKPIVTPGVGEAEAAQALSAFSQLAADGHFALTPNIEGIEQITRLMTGLGQLSGPIQQLMQPLQQLVSMAGQSGGIGGPLLADGLAGGKLGAAGAQVGLLGALPLSSHPMLGGSGPSVGMGLMHAEALPGSGGSGPRTSMMSQLIDKTGPGASPAGAGAGSSAMGGAAPMGAMGQGSQSGAAAKPGLSLPAAPGEQNDGQEPHDVDDEDDW